MTPRGRTNQLIYQAELLLDVPWSDDEHAVARRMASEEGALALLELALNSALREVTEHARLAHHDWRDLLSEVGEDTAEVRRLREVSQQPETWLSVLISRLMALHSVDGAARRDSSESLIVAADRAPLADEMRWCAREFKAMLGELRETSFEW